jgi:Uma2 family endonuclease
MASAPAIPWVTEEEFFAMPESHDRLELIDGELILSPSPLLDHQIVVGRLHFALMEWAHGHPPAGVGLSPLDVRIAPERVLLPDLFVLLTGFPADRTEVLSVVPELVVEVLSGTRTYDRVTKRLIYAEAGVQEYWIVDRDRREVEVVRGLETVAREGQTLRSPILPDSILEVPKLFG